VTGTRNGQLATAARFVLRLVITFNTAWSIEDYFGGRFADSKAELACAVAFTALYFVLGTKTRGTQPATEDEVAGHE